MKATEIKAKELVEKFWLSSLTITEKQAIKCAIISQQREVDLLHRIYLNWYLPTDLLQEAQEVLTILKEM